MVSQYACQHGGLFIIRELSQETTDFTDYTDKVEDKKKTYSI
jgi:hypothetical protein